MHVDCQLRIFAPAAAFESGSHKIILVDITFLIGGGLSLLCQAAEWRRRSGN